MGYRHSQHTSPFRAFSSGPFRAQGILAPADAQMAVAAGVDGIMLSNHGGRQLDYAPSPVEMLPHGETSTLRPVLQGC